ncbi:MAG TPA: hypothetical protein VMW38_08450, partial [Terriglobia bacterium]|nr:hypothetical protein [Terriglobia bacterium]
VEMEKRYGHLGVEPDLNEPKENTGQREDNFEIVQHLIQQALVREQVQTLAGDEATPEEVKHQFDLLEQKFGGRDLFEKTLQERHITKEALEGRLAWQIRVLKFLDNRFRQFVVILPNEIEEYYRNSLLPELARRGNSTIPALAEVQGQIRDLLIEDKVNKQIDGWLNSLTESADIEILK